MIYAQVAKGVAAIMLRNKLKVPDALAQATTAGVQEPPDGFERKIVHGKLKLVASDGAVAWRADDAYAAAASMEADTSLTPTAALDAARAARLDAFKGLRYTPRSGGPAQWFLDGAPEPVTRVDHAEALSLRLIDEGLVDRSYDEDERVKVAFDDIVREYYAVDGLDYEWVSGRSARVYFIEGFADACGSLRIRWHDDACACSRELVAGHFVGWGLLHPGVRDIFLKYATDTHGRTQAERDALGVVVAGSQTGPERAAAMATLFGDVSDLYDKMAPTAVIGEHVDMTIVTTPRIDSLFAAPPPSRVAAAPPSRERAAAAGTRSSGRERKAARRSDMLSTGEALRYGRHTKRRR